MQNNLNDIQEKLKREKSVIEKQIKELKDQDPFSDPNRLTDNAASDTDANEESAHDRYKAMLDELSVSLGDINSALVRIQEGGYGVCSSCKGEISKSRLDTMPAAQFCISCQKKK